MNESDIPKNLSHEIILTEAFEKTIVGLHHAVTNAKIVGFISPRGVGFKTAVRQFSRKHYLNVVVCDVLYAQKFNTVMLSLYRHLTNMRFSNIDPNRTDLFTLTRIINERINESKVNLLVLDNCANLTLGQFKYFIRFLKMFRRNVGLVFRMNDKTLKKIKRRWSDEFKDLYQTVDDWGILKSPSHEEIVDICRAHSVNDKMIINDLLKASSGNLSILKMHINRYLVYVAPENSGI